MQAGAPIGQSSGNLQSQEMALRPQDFACEPPLPHLSSSNGHTAVDTLVVGSSAGISAIMAATS